MIWFFFSFRVGRRNFEFIALFSFMMGFLFFVKEKILSVFLFKNITIVNLIVFKMNLN